MGSSTDRAVDEVAPDFTAPLVRADGEAERVALSSLLEDRPVLLSFYTADFSPDCINEWCSFRDFDWFSTGEAVQVVGISKSSVGLHRRFIKHLNLGFPLYADPDLDVAEAFGVDYRAFGVSRRARRSCFLIDRDRTIRYRWLSEHWLDPTRDMPPVGEIHDVIRHEIGSEETDSFGF